MKPARLLFAAALLLAATQTLHAQGTWPDKPVRIVVPLPPGGPSDIVLRTAIEKMQLILKQALILDNKPGAAGVTRFVHDDGQAVDDVVPSVNDRPKGNYGRRHPPRLADRKVGVPGVNA